MKTFTTTQRTDHEVQESAQVIFADPVAYLRKCGLESELVSEAKAPLQTAA